MGFWQYGQLIDLYGREGSETFFANADLHQFFGNTDPLTLEQISARLGVTDMKEVPLPPAAPMGTSLGLGQMIRGNGAKGKDDYVGQGMSVMGGAVSLLEQGGAALAQAKYQDDMNTYQREMALHGKARMPPEEVSALIRKKDDVVADHMICFLFGREPLLIKPAPFFRPLPTTAPEPQLTALPWHRTRKAHQITGAVLGAYWGWFLGADEGGLYMLFGMVGLGAVGTSLGEWRYKVFERKGETTEKE